MRRWGSAYKLRRPVTIKFKKKEKARKVKKKPRKRAKKIKENDKADKTVLTY